MGLLLTSSLALAQAVPVPPPLPDRGIFPELDSRVRIARPAWVGPSPTAVLLDESRQVRWFLSGGTPVGVAPAAAEPTVRVADLAGGDTDGDGLPDPVDILIGGKKTVLDRAPYRGGYRGLRYPGGDVPRTEGVCTDVVVRALRNAGLDLQQLLHEDILRRRAAYPMVRQPDTNIDQRRVATLLPWFRHHWRSRTTDPAQAPADWLPGDVVLMNTMRGPEPDHIGILSDQAGASGLPLVINSWTDGYFTAEMDLLTLVPVTHRFRVPVRWRQLAATERGLSGVLRRAGIELLPPVGQLLLVIAPHWTATVGELRRYQRDPQGRWQSVGPALAVSLGAGGLGWGLGLGPAGPREGPDKAEGDGRSPAGLFELGPAFGRGPRGPAGSRWPWQPAGPEDVWVDDPTSPVYNTWQRRTPTPPWRSAEALSRPDGLYDPALVIRHNTAPVQPGRGSAIFLHPWSRPGEPTAGCTALGRADLTTLLRWLDPAQHPRLLQLVAVLFE